MPFLGDFAALRPRNPCANILTLPCLQWTSLPLILHKYPTTGGQVMDDARYRTFFLQPTDPMHRHYEALRAVIVEQQPMQAVAQRLGYRYDSVRALVSRFRGQFDSGTLPPFSPAPAVDAPPTRPLPHPRGPTSLRSPTLVGSVWLPGGACELAQRRHLPLPTLTGPVALRRHRPPRRLSRLTHGPRSARC